MMGIDFTPHLWGYRRVIVMSDRCEHLTPDNTGFSTSHTRCTAKGKYQVGDFLYCGRHHLWHKVTHYRIKYKKAQTHISTLELALGDIRTIAMRALEDDGDHKNELRSIIPLCPPAPPVEIEWNKASERGFDAKIKRELVKNVLNNEEDVTKATDQIMHIFAKVK